MSEPGVEVFARQRGQATVELALSSIVLLLLVTGLLDLSRVFYFDVSLQSATREAARHAAWYDTASRKNIYLDDSEIVGSVNTSLGGSGLSVTGNSGSGMDECLAGAADNNPPYANFGGAAPNPYPASTSLNQPVLFICYTKPDGTQLTTLASAPTDNSWRLGDINVILLMNYGLITFFLQSQIGNGFHVAANSHFMIQGRP